MEIKNPIEVIYPQIQAVGPNWHMTTVVRGDGSRGTFFKSSAETVKECAIAFKNRGLQTQC